MAYSPGFRLGILTVISFFEAATSTPLKYFPSENPVRCALSNTATLMFPSSSCAGRARDPRGSPLQDFFLLFVVLLLGDNVGAVGFFQVNQFLASGRRAGWHSGLRAGCISAAARTSGGEEGYSCGEAKWDQVFHGLAYESARFSLNIQFQRGRDGVDVRA